MKASTFISWLLYTLAESWGYIWGKCGILWTQARQKALEEKYNSDPKKYSDYKMGVLYGARWIGHFVADCANLLRWAAKKSGDDAVHSGSNLIWQCDLAKKGELRNGQRTDGEPLKPGTFVFTGTKDSHGHVGGYIGGGYVIEDAETKTGVIKSRIDAKTSKGADKWTWWGERENMIFDVKDGDVILPAEMPQNGQEQPSEPADDEQPTQTLPTLRKGDKGDAVRYLQTILLEQGYDLGKWGVDGDFGSATEKAVKAFQKANGLSQDGVVGKKTWAVLTSAPENPKLYTVRIEHLTEAMADEIISKYGGEKTAE